MGEARKALYHFGYRRSPDQDAASPVRHPVVIVGAGPVGLSLAIDLALRGVKVVLLDDADRIGEGSRAICFAKRTLEIFDRLGVAGPMLEKGVTWKVGKVFWRDALLYQFDLLPEAGHQMPAFINLQQYYVEHFLAERAAALPEIDLRWSNRVSALDRTADGAILTVDTPDGPYALAAEWVIAADGARSTLRRLMGLEFRGQVFEDRFLIADIRMLADFPSERWFWFDPPFHSGRSALLHKQPDDIWRIDLQLPPDADPDEETRPDRVRPRLERMLGHSDFELEWVSLYSFQCRRLDRFVHGQIVFVGDAAHQVSPFGARGANSGIQDAENLAWKLAAVLKGEASPMLVGSYEAERSAAADENIAHSTRATDFMTPSGPAELVFRDAVLSLAGSASFAERMVNSGRLSTATIHDSPLSTPDCDVFAGTARLGAPLPDAPLRRADGTEIWLLEALPPRFHLIAFGAPPPDLPDGLATLVVGRDLADPEGVLARRLDATPRAAYLVRPDQHLAARWRLPDTAGIAAALERATMRTGA